MPQNDPKTRFILLVLSIIYQLRPNVVPWLLSPLTLAIDPLGMRPISRMVSRLLDRCNFVEARVFIL